MSQLEIFLVEGGQPLVTVSDLLCCAFLCFDFCRIFGYSYVAWTHSDLLTLKVCFSEIDAQKVSNIQALVTQSFPFPKLPK